MKSLYQRTITGLIYVSALIFALISGPYTYYILFALFIGIGTFELIKMFGAHLPLGFRISTLFLSVLTYTVIYADVAQLINFPEGLLASMLVMFFLIYKLFINDKRITEYKGLLALVFLYLVLPLSISTHLVFHHQLKFTYNETIVLYTFVFLWSNDTGAYVFGNLFGKHKFFERISPKKTWEGVIGGILFAVTAALIVSRFNHTMPLLTWLIMAFIAGISGTIGDLIESMIKRAAEVKDSGKIFPGHGGLLDRIDSFLFAILAIFVYFEITNLFT